MSAWRQFRELGVPRCTYGCGRLIWPWQSWVCEIEDWPKHHVCHHHRVADMLTWLLNDERKQADGYHSDMYDACRFCRRTTASGFVVALPAPETDLGRIVK